MIKSLVLVVVGLFTAATAIAEEGGGFIHKADTDIANVESLQRGARDFMSYCSGCHSLKYLRYNRMGADLGISDAELKNLIFGAGKAVDGIGTAMPKDAESWFGKQPPDLSLMARARGVDYIYSFLKGFYADPTRPWGVNNLVLPATAMPHVLVELQGLQKPVFKKVTDTLSHNDRMELESTEPMAAGELKPEEYDAFVRDIVNFLDYAGEPIKAKRQSMGVFVILFLLVFFVFAYLLKKEYWKDVH